MPDVQEVFRMATQKVRPDPGALERQLHEQRTRTVKRRAGAFALAAALAAVAAILAYNSFATSTDRTDDTAIEPSPNGFERGIFLVDVETGALTGILEGDTIWDPDVSRDGSTIAFHQSVGGYNQLHVMNADGTGVRAVTDARFGAEDPDWAPNSAALAYQALFEGETETDWDIWLLDLGSGRSEQLTHEKGEAFGASWSPDGSKILYTVGRPSDESVLRVIEVATGDVTQLTQKGEAAAEGSWSPDGSTIVYSLDAVRGGTDEEGRGSHGIWLVDADGSDKRELVATDAALFRPVYSPDGTRIAYFVEDDGGCCDTYVVDVGTGVSTKLAEGTVFSTWLDDDTLVTVI